MNLIIILLIFFFVIGFCDSLFVVGYLFLDSIYYCISKIQGKVVLYSI